MLKLQTIDLNLPKKLPSEIKLYGLSEPKFQSDGVYYRLTEPLSAIEFKLSRPAWVQYRFHSLLPDREVTAKISLNGKTLESIVFPASGRTVHYTAALGKSGTNLLSVSYTCGNTACPSPVPVYWLELGISGLNSMPARQEDVLNVERWNLLAPETPVEIQGVSPPLSDGTQPYRRVQENKVELIWPPGVQPLNLGFVAAGGVPFTITAQAGERVLGHWTGGPSQAVEAGLSLYASPSPLNKITLRVNCPPDESQCVNLYKMNMGIELPTTAPEGDKIVTSLLLVLLLLILVWWLGPWRSELP